ncbi:PAS domain S-box protein [uncultured Chitinophaga sp.]|jgi:PAS domain S-box|uniref:PAS domain-containing protein n=1 Tax=uncultured Chitinophaga sp. TaxID=339340 RepID=UPI0026026029|nr:PAS domain S-box protein [uncultured Chitinophaga sp.]
MFRPPSPLTTVIIYAICAVIWALSVDWMIAMLSGHVNPQLLTWLLHYKGIIFGLLSAVVLFLLLRNYRSQVITSERAYVRMFRENPQPMWIYRKRDFRYLEVNDAAIALYGYSREEFLQMTILDIRPKEDIERLLRNRDLQTKPGYSPSGIWRHFKKDGSLMYVRVEAFMIAYGDEPAEVISIYDVTEAHLAGEALNKQEQLLKTIINSSQKMVWAVNNQFQLIAENRVFRSRLALLRDIEKPSEFWLEHYKKSLCGEKQLIAYESGTTERTWRYMEISFDPICDQGSITGVACMAGDVTREKLHELTLRKALERYEVVTMATNDVIWDFDLVNRQVSWSDNAIHFFGFSKREEEPEFWASRIHPEEREDIMNSLYQAVREGHTHWQREYRLIDLKGQYRHVVSRGYILYNEQKEPVRMIGAMQDIEEIVVKNEEIRRLSLVASMTHNPVIITDENACIEWVNKSFEDLSGYALEEIKGLKPYAFLHGEDTDTKIYQEISEKLAAGKHCVVELLNYSSSGEPYWIVMDITPIVNQAGEVERHIIIQTNITEKKKFEQQLEERNRLLTEVAFISSHRLRMPVASLLGLFAQMDKENLANPDNRPFLEYMEKLVNDLDVMLHEMADKCNQIYHKSEEGNGQSFNNP